MVKYNALGRDSTINRAIAAILQHDMLSDAQEKAIRIEPNNKDDLSIWHRFMQWPTSFHDKDLSVYISGPRLIQC